MNCTGSDIKWKEWCWQQKMLLRVLRVLVMHRPLDLRYSKNIKHDLWQIDRAENWTDRQISRRNQKTRTS